MAQYPFLYLLIGVAPVHYSIVSLYYVITGSEFLLVWAQKGDFVVINFRDRVTFSSAVYTYFTVYILFTGVVMTVEYFFVYILMTAQYYLQVW
jgi:hypothetical protein